MKFSYFLCKISNFFLNTHISDKNIHKSTKKRKKTASVPKVMHRFLSYQKGRETLFPIFNSF